MVDLLNQCGELSVGFEQLTLDAFHLFAQARRIKRLVQRIREQLEEIARRRFHHIINHARFECGNRDAAVV